MPSTEKLIAQLDEVQLKLSTKLTQWKLVGGGTAAFGVFTWGIGAVVLGGSLGAQSLWHDIDDLHKKETVLIAKLTEQGINDKESVYSLTKIPSVDEVKQSTLGFFATVGNGAKKAGQLGGALMSRSKADDEAGNEEEEQAGQSPTP